MGRHVVVLASGETERRALPHLVSHLREQNTSVVEVRIPPRNRTLDAQMAESLIKAAWFERSDNPPCKFVLLVDTDGKAPEEVLAPYHELSQRLCGTINAAIRLAYAERHLEAWYFADAANLRGWLGRALGKVDTSKPDKIQNPKLHLKHLLGSQVYTARVSEEIASSLDALTIAQRSPGFRRFVNAVMNGP